MEISKKIESIISTLEENKNILKSQISYDARRFYMKLCNDHKFEIQMSTFGMEVNYFDLLVYYKIMLQDSLKLETV